MHSDFPNKSIFIKEIVHVLSNLLLSKNEEVAISAIDIYSILPRFLFFQIICT